MLIRLMLCVMTLQRVEKEEDEDVEDEEEEEEEEEEEDGEESLPKKPLSATPTSDDATKPSTTTKSKRTTTTAATASSGGTTTTLALVALLALCGGFLGLSAHLPFFSVFGLGAWIIFAAILILASAQSEADLKGWNWRTRSCVLCVAFGGALIAGTVVRTLFGRFYGIQMRH
jgi:hypothetical protein